MANSFSALKKGRKDNLSKLKKNIEDMQKGGNVDDRFWKLTVDAEGNGYAVIRFIPAKGDDIPHVRVWDHYFKGPKGWYVEKSLHSIGGEDPCSEYNSMLWETGDENNQKQVRRQKRRLNYYANIYVVADPANPENEGKTFLFRFGSKIFDKISEAINPKYEDPFDPFDFWEGANFKIKAATKDDYRNYDNSAFESPSPISDKKGKELSEDAMEAVYSASHSLQEFIDPSTFKSYDELKARLYKVLDLSDDDFDAPEADAPSEKSEDYKSDDVDDGSDDVEDEVDESVDEEEEDETAAFFRNLQEIGRAHV